MSSAPQSAGLDLVPPTSAPGAPVGPAPAAPSNPPPTAQSGARRGASSVVASVILTALTIAGVEVCARAIGPIPSPSPILLLAVCTSAFIGGLPSGILSAAMCMLYGAFYFSEPHWPLRYDGEHTMRVIILSVTAPAMAVLVGLLRRRAERAAAEVSRQQSEQRFLQTFDRAAVGMATISLSGRWLRVNPELCQILGHTCERLEGRDWQDTVVRDDAAVLSTHLQKLLTGELDWFQADARHTRGDASHELIWTQQTITLIRDDEGRPDHLIAVVNDVSDRKAAEDARRRAQEALRRSERQFRQAIIDAPIPVMMHAEDGQILQLSRAWTESSGYTIEDIPTFPDWLRVAFGDDQEAERARANIAALFERPPTKEVRDQEFVVTTKSGERRTWSFSASSPGVLEDGRRYVVTMARDITFRKRAQEQLAASELRYRSLVTASAQVVWRTGPNGETLEDLPMWREFTGQTYDQMKSHGWLDVVHPDDIERVKRAWGESLRTRSPYENEFRVRAADGDWRHMLARGVPVIDDQGRLLEWVGSLRDVTERRQAEQRLREGEERYERAAAAGRVGVWELDLSTNELYLAPNLKRMLGYADDELPDRLDAWAALVHPDDQERVAAATREHLENRTPVYEVEMRRRRKDGSYGWYLARGTAVRDEQGRPMRLVGSDADVTARREAIQELQRMKDAAEGANRAKDQFLAALSHELRTPLTPVLLAAAALGEDESLPESVREDLDIIRRNVEMEARLIDDLLDLTRVARGKIQLDLRPVDPVVCLEAAIDVCSDDARAKNIDLMMTCEPAAAAPAAVAAADNGDVDNGDADDGAARYVRGDSGRLQQIFWNLLKNAVKFTPLAGTIRVRCSTPRPDVFRVDVIDNGIGIDADVLPRIFDAFEQGDQSVSKQFGGLGLGLAITKALTEMHGGRLMAASEGRGKGATFSLELPAISVPREQRTDIVVSARRKRRDRPVHPAPSSDSPPPKPLRILLVEDHDATSRVLSMLLRRLNHDVTTAGTVAVARQAAQSQRFDLVISDIGLPDGSGLDLMRELRETYQDQLKGICLSGYGMDQDVIQSRAAGFAHHLTKPVDFPKLKATIDSVAP